MPKQINDMNKKELKDHINTNGFFFHIQCDKITKDDMEVLLTDAAKQTGGKVTKTGNEIPLGDNIITFKGIASQNYAKGEKSRNGYKYDQNGWDYSAYTANATILWQHDTQYGGIGRCNSLWIDNAGNQNIIFYVDLDTLEDRNAIQVQRGFVSAISTGAIAKEYMFEEADTGAMYTEQDAEEKFGWENVMRAYFGSSDVLTLVVTKAEMIENSLVTIGSNENAIAMQNAIGNHFQEVGDRYKKNHLDTAEETTTTVDAEENSEVVLETKEEPTTQTEPVKAEENSQEETTQVTPTAESTEEGAESTEEKPAPVEQTEAETEDETKAKESAAQLADALEQIATQANTISEMKAKIDADKADFEAFKDEVYETMSTFIKSHNDAVDTITDIETNLKNVRVSKGLPHIRQNDVLDKKSPLTDVVRSIKRND